MNSIDLNEHDRDRGALAASIDRTTGYIEQLRSEQVTAVEEPARTIDLSSSQLNEAMDDINDGGGGNPAQFSTDV